MKYGVLVFLGAMINMPSFMIHRQKGDLINEF
jgi:hypothetical protein